VGSGISSPSPSGMATNGSDFWVLDGDTIFINHFDKFGNNQSDGFSLVGKGCNSPQGIVTNGSDFWVACRTPSIMHFDKFGNNLSDSFNTPNVTQCIDLATNGSDFWTVNDFDRKIYQFNNGTQVAVLDLGVERIMGFDTNGTDFWMNDYPNLKIMFHKDRFGNNISNFSLSSMGITSTTRMQQLNNGKDLYIMDYADNFIYHIQYTPPNITTPSDTTPIVSLHSPNDSLITDTTNINFNCSTQDDFIIENISLYLDGNLNYTITNGVTNFSELFLNLNLNEGYHNWTCNAYDNATQLGVGTTRYFNVTTIPNIQYISPTPNNETWLNINSFIVNVSLTETYFQNVTFYLYNETGEHSQATYTNSVRQHTFSSLPNGNYTYYVTTWTNTSQSKTTEIRSVYIDTIYPTISFGSGTLSSGVNVSQNYLYLNTTWTETNFQNITFRLYNSGGLYSSQTFVVPTYEYSYNFTLLPQGYYSYNVTITDKANNRNTTETRFNILLDTSPPVAEHGYTGGSGGSGYVQGVNNTYTNNTNVNFTANITDNFGIDNVTITIMNETGGIINKTTSFWGGVFNVIVGLPLTLLDGVYRWVVEAWDTASNYVTTNILTLFIDTAEPNVTFSSFIVNVSTNTLPTNIVINYSVNETNINACYYQIDGGTNQTLNCSETSATIPITSESYHDITISGIDLAGNSESDTKVVYIFYHTYNQTTVNPIATEGTAVTFNIAITETDYGSTIAYLNYNGIDYLADSYNIVGDNVSFTKQLIIPDGSGNETGKEALWNWKYSIVGNSFWEENFSTTNQSQIIYSVEMDDCSNYTEVILHFDFNDEETDTTIPFNIGNTSTTPSVEAEVVITSLADSDLSWQFEKIWTNVSEGSICVPSVLLNYSSYRFDGVLGYVADGYAQEFWYVSNGTLEYGNFNLSDFTQRNITLRDLLLEDSTTFLFKYYDENFLIKPQSIVSVLRKYIGEGVFKEVERCQLDDNGECHLHLVEEDVIYEFRLTYFGDLEYLSGEYNAKCIQTPCGITLSKTRIVGEWDTEYDALAKELIHYKQI